MHRQASAAQSPLAQAHGTSSKMRSYFYPWERLTTERPNTIRLARCKMSSQAFSPRGKDLAMQRDFGLKPRKPAYPPGLETQRLATDRSSVNARDVRAAPRQLSREDALPAGQIADLLAVHIAHQLQERRDGDCVKRQQTITHLRVVPVRDLVVVVGRTHSHIPTFRSREALLAGEVRDQAAQRDRRVVQD